MVKKNKIIIRDLPLKAIIILILAASAIGFVIYEHNVAKAWSNLIYPGVKIENQDVSGKTKAEAQAIIRKKCDTEILKKKLNIKTPEKTYTLDYSKLDPKYNFDEAVNEAFKYGKDANLFKKYILIKHFQPKEYDLKFTYNMNPVNELVDNIEKEVNKDPVDATLSGTEGNFTVVSEQKGKKLQKDKLKKELSSKINGKIGQDSNIQVSIQDVDARITGDKIKSINYKVSQFSTEYGSISSSERANNIMLATKSINGKILLPGDTFSFNDIVGERTAARGYEAAPVIIGNQVDSGLGGGICQVSTTLYNAIIRANIKSTERTHHTLPSHYVKVGMDATVDYGSLDYKFKNTLDYPIYIEGDSSGGMISFNVYSNNSLAGIVTDITTNVYQTIEANTSYVDDPNLPDGQMETEQAPSTGYKVKVTKTTSKDGKVISQEQIADDFYKPVDGVIRRGTKK